MRPGSRRRLRPGVLPLLLLVVIVAGCADPSGPAPSPRIELEVRPDSVVPGDSLEVVVSVVNPTGETITLTSMCGGVLYWLEAGVVDGDEDHVRLGGLDQGCFWSVTDVELPPGTRTSRWRVRLDRPGGSPAAPGRYRVVARSLARELDDDRATARVAVR